MNEYLNRDWRHNEKINPFDAIGRAINDAKPVDPEDLSNGSIVTITLDKPKGEANPNGEGQ